MGEYNRMKSELQKTKDILTFLEIKPYLNGYGRIIYYSSNDPFGGNSKCTITKIIEG